MISSNFLAGKFGMVLISMLMIEAEHDVKLSGWIGKEEREREEREERMPNNITFIYICNF